MRDCEDVFTGLSCLPGEYRIEIDPTIRPVQHTPRRIPVPLKAKLKEKIDEMEKEGIIPWDACGTHGKNSVEFLFLRTRKLQCFFKVSRNPFPAGSDVTIKRCPFFFCW